MKTKHSVIMFGVIIILLIMTPVFADTNQSVLLQYRAEVKNITLSGVSYSIQLDKYVGRSEGASFIYSGEKTGMLTENDSYTFSNALQLTVTKLTYSGFDNTGIIHIQLDDANVNSEHDEKLPSDKTWFIERILRWLKELFT